MLAHKFYFINVEYAMVTDEPYYYNCKYNSKSINFNKNTQIPKRAQNKHKQKNSYTHIRITETNKLRFEI